MSGFNIAVAVQGLETYNGDDLATAVAAAMEPHRGQWSWYAIGIQWPGVYAYIDTSGGWNEESDTWLPYEDWIRALRGSPYVVVHVRCKGSP